MDLLEGFSKQQLAKVTVTPAPSEDQQALREEEKRLMIRRRQLRDILENWDQSLVSTKARRVYGEQLGVVNAALKDIRSRRLG